MNTCEKHDELTQMVAKNTTLTEHTLRIVIRVEDKMDRLAREVAERAGAAGAAKTSVAWVIGALGVLIAAAALLVRVVA